MQKRKRTKVKQAKPTTSVNKENDDEVYSLNVKKTRQYKKKTKDKEERESKGNQDPSRAKVVLQKLNDSQHSNFQLNENDRKNSEESLTSV